MTGEAVPLVSVVIPSYNHARFIRSAIASVLLQTVRDVELIVVDDGSTDESLSLIQSIGDDRLRWVSQANQGAHAAINRGLSLSRGSYLAILNSDDVFAPARLKRLLETLENQPGIGLAASYIALIDSDDRVIGMKQGYIDANPWPLDEPSRSFRAQADLRTALLTENYLATTSNFVFPRATYDRVGEFWPLRYAHDWDWALRVSKQLELTLLPDALLQYRVHAGNTIRENKAAMIYEICWILARHLPGAFQPGTPESFERLLYSLHAFGCEQVVIGLLSYKISDHDGLALAVLSESNEFRRASIEFIKKRLSGSTDAIGRGWRSRFESFRKLFRGNGNRA